VASLKRKQSTAPSGSDNNPSTKRARPSGALALHGMNERLEDFTEVFREAFTGKRSGILSTPQRKSKAMQRAQELETTLSDQCIVGLVDLFRADITMADTYLSLHREGVRKQWVHNHTKHLENDDEDANPFA
jgi:hypothetical protein